LAELVEHGRRGGSYRHWLTELVDGLAELVVLLHGLLLLLRNGLTELIELLHGLLLRNRLTELVELLHGLLLLLNWLLLQDRLAKLIELLHWLLLWDWLTELIELLDRLLLRNRLAELVELLLRLLLLTESLAIDVRLLLLRLVLLLLRLLRWQLRLNEAFASRKRLLGSELDHAGDDARLLIIRLMRRFVKRWLCYSCNHSATIIISGGSRMTEGEIERER